MDHLHNRLDALEQQVHMLHQQTHTVARQLRWWRGLACGLVVLAGLTWALPAVIAQEGTPEHGQKGLAHRVAALEKLLKHFSREKNEIFITGANLHIVNGLGQTACGSEEEPIPDCPNGLGNLIVGYNELRKELPDCESDPTLPFCTDMRTGSHNVVVGPLHNFSRVGGLVVGFFSEISGNFASVSGGRFNTVSGDYASVSGGQQNTASGEASSVSGGIFNMASGGRSSVSGGDANTASGERSWVSGGGNNTASRESASVSGGFGNTASGGVASVSGGLFNTASGDHSSVSGGRQNTANADASSVSGGSGNTASGMFSSVSGGGGIDDAGLPAGIIVSESNGWAAGTFGEEISGNFRSP
jgi:hypothetical protein